MMGFLRELLNQLHETGLLDLLNKQKGFGMTLLHRMERHYCVLSFPPDVADAEADSEGQHRKLPPSAIAFEVIGKGASVKSTAKTELESPEKANEKPSIKSKVHLTHDQEDQKYEHNLANDGVSQYLYWQTPIGVAMALCHTSVGGSTLYMETALVEKGEAIGCLNIIGLLGEETFVSACIAYKLAHQILLRKQPENTFFANSMLCLHLLTCKGTSEGCAMITSFLSLAMKKTVRRDLAMTGTVTLTGKNLRIGRVKEKTIGARQNRMTIRRKFLTSL